jgi:hypothetical protein
VGSGPARRDLRLGSAPSRRKLRLGIAPRPPAAAIFAPNRKPVRERRERPVLKRLNLKFPVKYGLGGGGDSYTALRARL